MTRRQINRLVVPGGVALVLTVAWCAIWVAGASGRSSRSIPGFEWERYYGAKDYVHAYRVATVDPSSGDLVLGVRRRRVDAAVSAWELWLSRIDSHGRLSSEFRVPAPPEVTTTLFADIVGIAPGRDGVIMAVVEYTPGAPWCLKLTPTGSLVLARDLSLVVPRAKIHAVAPAPEGHFLLLGQVDGDALAIKGDDAGDLSWHKTFDRGATESLIAGARNNAGFVVLGVSGRPGALARESPRLWLMSLDDQGHVAAESLPFSGRDGSIPRNVSGVLALVYDRSDSAAQDIRLVSFNERLSTIAETGILTVPRGMGSFHVGPSASGDVIVVGSADFKLWIARVTVDGKIRWASTIPQILAARFGLVTDNHHALIPWTAIEESGEKREIVSKVGVIKINTKRRHDR